MGVDGAVQATAYLAAAARAAETGASAPRLYDPLADRFAAERPPGQPSYRGLLDAGGDEVVARTVLIDQLVTAVIARGAPSVLVNLGAGFCTRPYRLDLSGCGLVLECDAAEVLAVKQRVLADARPSTAVRRVELDLRDTDGLAAALVAHTTGAERVVVITEGVLPYLPASAVETLATGLAGLPAPVWLTDVISGESAQAMGQLARAAHAPVTLYGLGSLGPLERGGWQVSDYRVLPVPRRGPLGRRPGSGTQGASHQVVDGVLALRRLYS